MEMKLDQTEDIVFYFEKDIADLCYVEGSKLSGLLVQGDSPLRYNSTIGKAPKLSYKLARKEGDPTKPLIHCRNYEEEWYHTIKIDNFAPRSELSISSITSEIGSKDMEITKEIVKYLNRNKVDFVIIATDGNANDFAYTPPNSKYRLAEGIDRLVLK